jgi:hypothetical protein
MNSVIFVSVMCIAQQCAFVTSMDVVSEKKCQELKREFLTSKFKPEVTLAAAQCMEFAGEKVKV